MDKKTQYIEELKPLVIRAEKHQKALSLSDAEFARRYKDFVGSSKTWRQRLLGGDYTGLNLERILKKMRAFSLFLDGGTSLEDVYENLPIFQEFFGRFHALRTARTDRRVMVFLGETGVGKSICARAAVRLDPAEVKYVRCQPTWKDNHLSILNGILKSLGKPTYTRKNKALDSVLENLKSINITLIFDEAHDGGGALLKIVKSLVDETNCRFVIMAYPTLWKEMLLASTGTLSEAKQLFGRTQKPVFDTYATGTTQNDVEVFLDRSTSLNGASKDVAAKIYELARQNGNLRFVADIVEAADIAYMEEDTELDGARVIEIAQTLASVKLKGDK